MTPSPATCHRSLGCQVALATLDVQLLLLGPFPIVTGPVPESGRHPGRLAWEQQVSAGRGGQVIPGPGEDRLKFNSRPLSEHGDSESLSFHTCEPGTMVSPRG